MTSHHHHEAHDVCAYCGGTVVHAAVHAESCPGIAASAAAGIAAPRRRTPAEAAATNAVLAAMGSGLRVPATEPADTAGNAIDATLVQLAAALQEPDDLDTLFVVQLLQPLLAPAIHAELCTLLEVCPTHLQDHEICADDRLDCADGRAAAAADAFADTNPAEPTDPYPCTDPDCELH
jgi:hypothetical protein